MFLTVLLRFHALLAAPYGLCLLLVPKGTVKIFSELQLGPTGIVIARLFGAAMLLIALVTWGASSLTDLMARRLITRSLFIYTSIGFMTLLVSQMTGQWNALGWLNVLSYLIFVVGYGFFLGWQSRSSQQ